MAALVLDETAVRAAPGWRGRWPAWIGYATAVWSLAYGALGVYWALGGAGFPFGDAGADDWMSLLGGLRAEVGGPLIAGLGLTGAAVAVAMARSWGRGIARGALLGFGWGACATLLLVVPDARVLALLGYLPALVFKLGFDAVDWPILNQAVCMAGGFAWGMATLPYGRRTRGAGTRRGRTAAGTGWTAPDAASRWGRWVTYAAVVLPLPYAATRLAWALGVPLGLSGELGASFETEGARIAETSLGGMALGGALLTLGLVQRWGEVFPRWVPVLGGKRVPPALAIVPATLVSVALTAGGLTMFRLQAAGSFDGTGWGAGAPTLLFLPWGVALGLATLAYHQRRSGSGADRGRGEAGPLPSRDQGARDKSGAPHRGPENEPKGVLDDDGGGPDGERDVRPVGRGGWPWSSSLPQSKHPAGHRAREYGAGGRPRMAASRHDAAASGPSRMPRLVVRLGSRRGRLVLPAAACRGHDRRDHVLLVGSVLLVARQAARGFSGQAQGADVGGVPQEGAVAGLLRLIPQRAEALVQVIDPAFGDPAEGRADDGIVGGVGDGQIERVAGPDPRHGHSIERLVGGDPRRGDAVGSRAVGEGPGDQLLEPSPRIGDPVEHRDHRLGALLCPALDGCFEEGIPVREVPVEAAFGHAQALRQRLDGDRVDAPLGDRQGGRGYPIRRRQGARAGGSLRICHSSIIDHTPAY